MSCGFSIPCATSDARDWPERPLALEAGYADQSHFIREFKALAGVTPTEFAAERRTGIVRDESADHI